MKGKRKIELQCNSAAHAEEIKIKLRYNYFCIGKE